MTRYALPVVLVALACAACGSQKSTPTTPSTQSPATTLGSSTTIDLGVTTAPGVEGAGYVRPVVGVVEKLAGTCPGRTFVLSGVTIHLSASTIFESGSCAELVEGVRAGAMGAKRADGGIDAHRVKIGTPPPPPNPGPTKPPVVMGTVSRLSGECPALTFVLGGVIVHTNAATVFEGGRCAAMRPEMRAAALGRKADDGSILATHVRVMIDTPPDLIPLKGVIGDVTGSCPSVTFTIGNTTVHTNAQTVFEGGACGDVKKGISAGAIGARRDNGSMVAERVRLGGEPMPAATGNVGSLAGTCPNLTFVLGGAKVATSANTRYGGGACGDVKDGVAAIAMGPKNAAGVIEAHGVKIGAVLTPR